MPRRNDLEKILIFGSGPIVIGQACEFDYSGTQAVKALKEEGYTVVLHNSNPATIMTDPELADSTYIEPLTLEFATAIIARERPDAILPTLGGQTALNLAFLLDREGVLKKYGVELIGARADAIARAEDRQLFKDTMVEIGLKVPRSGSAHSQEEAYELAKELSFPLIIRPAFTLGGTGGGVAYNLEEFEERVRTGLELSPIHEILIEESVLGWKEYELEVMRDLKDQVVIICTIENFDPMGVHTGDSITVAPAQTLTDREYQRMRDAAIKIIRAIGVDTGGSNIQFAVHPQTGEMVVIEMNPRVSRSSALASKATGYPIARVAAKLAVGYTLDELANEITRKTPASFEPTIDYVVVKIPRFAFEKFRHTPDSLTTTMRSVGEVMAIGRTFCESLQKAIQGLEVNCEGLESLFGWDRTPSLSQEIGESQKLKLEQLLRIPNSRRLFAIADAFRAGMGIEELNQRTAIDPWFLKKIETLVHFERRWIQFWKEKYELFSHGRGNTGDGNGGEIDEAVAEELKELLLEGKKLGFSDRRLSQLWNLDERIIEDLRRQLRIFPALKQVDTCAGEFESLTPYIYSTYDEGNEITPLSGPKVMILGSGPNRIGQGIEFDYCCVHATLALRSEGVKAIMVNCNPETVSTDFDISDRLYFEPVTLERTLHLVEFENPRGVMLQFGGQTPLKLAKALEKRKVPILGTSPEAIDIAEDRDRFRKLIEELGLLQPRGGVARSPKEAREIARAIGYPVLLRPSYVLGGRAMEIVYDEDELLQYIARATEVSPEHPVLVDSFLEDAQEFDVDALADGREVWVAGVLQHIEAAGVHSGDSSCLFPPHPAFVSPDLVTRMMSETTLIAQELKVIGLINVQFAVKDGKVYILEVNPRASRTVPFISKVLGVPLAKLAARLALGHTLHPEELPDFRFLPYYAVKEAVLPFDRFPGEDALLGPEMKSTGEVMGIDSDYAMAFAKAQIAAGTHLPREGRIFISVSDRDKGRIVEVAAVLARLGYSLVATRGTARYLETYGIHTEVVNKITEGRPHIVDLMKNRHIHLVINTPLGARAAHESAYIRKAAVQYRIPYFTTSEAARMASRALESLHKHLPQVLSLREWYALQKRREPARQAGGPK